MSKASRRRLKIVSVIAVITLLLVGVLLAYWQATSGPRFKGQSVERWLASFSNEPDLEVINGFGISACPDLLSVLARDESRFSGIWIKLPRAFRSRLRHLDPSRLPQHQRLAAQWLNALGTDAEAVVPQLMKIVPKKPDLASTLAFVGRNRREAIEVLGTLLDHTNNMVRENVALTPGVLRTNALPLLSALTNFIVSHPRQAPFNAILGVGLIGSNASNAVPLLAGFLTNSNLVGNTLTALENIGTGAVAAVFPLCELLKRAAPDKQLSIVECLYAIEHGISEAAPHLRKIQSAETNLLQLLVSLTLAKIENNREGAAAALARSLAGRKVRSNQTFTITLPDTRTTLGMYHGLTHPQFAAVIAASYPDRPELLPYLHEALDGSDKWLRILAARAVWRHTHSTAPVLPVIVNALLSDSVFEVHFAVEALKEMPLKKEELPSLIQFAENMRRPWQQRMQIVEKIRSVDPSFQLRKVPTLDPTR